MLLAGKKIIVTGASRGIGRAIAVACAREGAVVGVNYLHSSEAAESLRDTSPDQFRLMQFDVTDPVAVCSATARFVEQEGTIDCLVNNAGVIAMNLFIKTDWSDVRKQIEVNFVGPMICAHAVLPFMLKQRKGVILNLSSVAAERPLSGQVVYAATKGGLESLTYALAVEYGRRNIRVIGIRPGPIDTDMLKPLLETRGDEIISRVPMHRLGSPEDVAELAVYLLSDKAQFASGAIFTIDGGYLPA